ncbi:hypothetical protein [Massilia sp. CT11-137]|uniref:hypothetical protein n=1 Tax=Massilia sp. CT11-137 TaxID=3393901 RepID=UPI0039AFEC1F
MQIHFVESHPKQKLLFFLAQDVDDEARKLVRDAIEKMSSLRTWVIRAPEFVDTVESTGTRPGDALVETVGGVHEIYSASPSNHLPREIDALLLEEVEYIVDSVQRLSQEHGLEFEFELDGQYVGTIDNGVIDAILAKGLIEEWRNHINAAN